MNIDVIKRKLLVKYPMFGSILANVEFREDRGCLFNGNPTAATDGKDIIYHPDFISSLSIDEAVFIFAHELCHIAFDHVFRSKDKDKRIWNIATDAVINALLKKDGLPLVKGGVDIEEAVNYTAEAMYEKLLKEKNQNDKYQSEDKVQSTNEKSHSNDSNDNSQDDELNKNENVGHDSHDMWEEAINKKELEENLKNDKSSKTEENESLLDKIKKMIKEQLSEQTDEKNEEQKNDIDKLRDKDIEKLSNMGETDAFKQNKIEKKKNLENMRQSLVEQSQGIGTESLGEIRKISNLGEKSNLIDWRHILKEAIQYDVDWSFLNATIENGVVTPYLEEKPFPVTEIVLDTSGSIDEILLRNFLKECKNILESSKVKVGCFDNRFYGFTEIRNVNDIDNMEFVGGGGTNFDAAINAFSKRVDNRIIFTDGKGYMPEKALDVIWIVFGDYKINPDGGKVIYISYDLLNELEQRNNRRL